MQTLYSTFNDLDLAQKCIGALLDHGLKAEDMSLVLHESMSGRLQNEKQDVNVLEKAAHGISTTTGADAGAGAAKGAGIGLGIGVLAGILSLVIPGFGLVYGGGALATAVGAAIGTTVGGAIAGGVTGYLKDQGVPTDAAERYNTMVSQGNALLAVQLPAGEMDQAAIRQIISKYGGSNFSSYGVL